MPESFYYLLSIAISVYTHKIDLINFWTGIIIKISKTIATNIERINVTPALVKKLNITDEVETILGAIFVNML